MQLTYLTYEPINIVSLLEHSHHRQAGAIVLFSGETRDNHQGKDVLYLEYFCQEQMAQKELEKLVAYTKEKWHLIDVILVHRLGRVDIKETSVLIITVAAHRAEAYEANRYLIDTLKSEIPIWKKEFYADSTEQWQ